MIAGLAHVNLIIPDGSLEQATEFYGNTLGLTPRKVPEGQRHRVAWFDIGSSGQQVHLAYAPDEKESSRHPCFKLESPEKLVELQKRVYQHFEKKDRSSPRAADQPGKVNSGRSNMRKQVSSLRRLQVRRVWSFRKGSSRGTMLAIDSSSACNT